MGLMAEKRRGRSQREGVSATAAPAASSRCRGLLGTTMSYCQQEGKDRIIFVTKEDHETPSSAELVADHPNDPYEEHGLILPNGDINWNCPYLGGNGQRSLWGIVQVCLFLLPLQHRGYQGIRLHRDQFRAMQECMQKYPDLYPRDDEEEEEEKPVELVEETADTKVSEAKEQGASS